MTTKSKFTGKKINCHTVPLEEEFWQMKKLRNIQRKSSHTSTTAKISGFANNTLTSGGQGNKLYLYVWSNSNIFESFILIKSEHFL